MTRKAKPYDLSPSELDLSKFDWSKKDGKLVAEMSDFGPGRAFARHISRLYNDACDVGIAIRSHVTGDVQRFYLSEEKTDGEGDLQYLKFKPEDNDSRVQEVIVFND